MITAATPPRSVIASNACSPSDGEHRTAARAGGMRSLSEPARCGSVRQTVNDIVDAEFIRLVGLVDRPKARPGPFPELRHIGVVVDDHLQTLGWIVVLVDAA